MKLRHKTIKTTYGSLKTPFFMPDATRGVVKLLDGSDLKKAGVGPMVVNTLHLYLQPGLEVIKKAGGIHKFMNWDKPLLSDSGGFQVFSLVHKNKNMGKIQDKGVVFRSPLDGSKHLLTPEKSIRIQFDLGTDMMVVFDDCPPNNAGRKQIEISVERTIKWAKRSKLEYERQLRSQKSKVKSQKHRPLLFGVIQGGMHKDLRKHCFEELEKIGFDGYGFGGYPVDEKGEFRHDILKYVADLIPQDKLRFALGIGTPEDIKKCFQLGWDMFDCVIPTREGRHGRLYKETGRVVNINNAKFKNNFNAISKNSKIPELKEHSLAYLHHLFKSREILAARLGSLNNLEYYIKLLNNLKK